MRKLLIRRPGGPGVLELVEGPDPVPGPGEVAVEVRAAGVNFADLMVRQGYYEAARGLYPIVPGFEFAGAVADVGPGVADWRAGDQVLGVTRFGACASRVIVPQGQIWAPPPGWRREEAAALPAAHLTAYYGLRRAARVEPGERLLIHSAAGGVGTAFLALARILGCPAVAVVGSSRKAALCLELGAQAVIDRSSQDLWKEARRLAPAGYDAVFDSGGVGTLRPGYGSLAPGGRLVVYGFAEMLARGGRTGYARLAWNYLSIPRFSPFGMTKENRGLAGFNLVYLFHMREWLDRAMREMLGWARDGSLARPKVTVFPFDRAAEAHERLASGETVGKLVLVL